MPNALTFEQSATLLNAVVQQATGQSAIGNITTAEDLVSVAQTALKTGYDPILNAISQVWSKTIFSSRAYNAPNSSLEFDLARWGNAVRKISPVAGSMVDDDSYKYPVAYDGTQTDPLGNGQSVDHYKISKQEVIQTNFYGSSVYEQYYTIFKDQFDAAMNNASEFAAFNGMNMTERFNDREQYREQVARVLQANFIGGLVSENQSGRIIHLLTEYNTKTGLSLTAQTVYQPANFAPFMRWCYARIQTLAKLFSERSLKFQTVINSKAVLRHTPASELRVAIFDPLWNEMKAMVLSDTYHDDYLKGATFEPVMYWQSISTPDTIKVQPTYTNTSGVATKAESVVTQANIVGILHDRNAMGYHEVNQWSAVTPLNIRGGYWNEAYHSTFKTISDNTEKAVLLVLD